MNNSITQFYGSNRWLSNFELVEAHYDGLVFTNNEAAFQAQKDLRPEIRQKFTKMSPWEAKKAGSRGGIVILRKDWEEIKERVMYEINLDKFTRHQYLKDKLLATGDAHLEEANNHGDMCWGTVNGKGKNLLGKILMRIRLELK